MKTADAQGSRRSRAARVRREGPRRVDGRIIGMIVLFGGAILWATGCSKDDCVECTDTTPPAVPSGVFSVTGDNQVTLYWNDVAEADVAGYAVYRNVDGSSTFFPPEGRTVRAIGFDDAPFERARRGDVSVAGVVCAGTRFEGLVWGRVRRDGWNATRELVLVDSTTGLPEIFELLFSDAIIPFKLGDYTIMQTVMLVEQMSLPVPNYVEAYLLFCGFPADKVHSSVDGALGVVHGVWPDKLA